MPKISAGILIYRLVGNELEVLLVHPGGPFWSRKDLGAWTIPKGEPSDGDDLLTTAHRELHEETGFAANGKAISLGQIRQAGGKTVRAWAIAGDVDPTELRSNTFDLEWPRGSNNVQSFPEVDRAQWFRIAEARTRLNPAQVTLLDRLASEIERLE